MRCNAVLFRLTQRFEGYVFPPEIQPVLMISSFLLARAPGLEQRQDSTSIRAQEMNSEGHRLRPL